MAAVTPHSRGPLSAIATIAIRLQLGLQILFGFVEGVVTWPS
jgi:hypothetical protein